MSSVLSLFIFNILSFIHSATSSISLSYYGQELGSLRDILELWSWESSAKRWFERPDLQMTLLRDSVYKVNKRGPRTESCGTPHFKTDGVDS